MKPIFLAKLKQAKKLRCSFSVSRHSHAVAKGVSGFTLVELSIVIIIISLIVAGITAGQSLVKTVKISSVISDINKYKIAVNAFKLQYGYYPGDLSNAVSYFGVTTVGGNGNNKIDTFPEEYAAWQHLNMAGLVPGNYTGVGAAPGAGTAIIGSNVPASSISKAGYSFEYAANATSGWVDGGWFGNTIIFGAYAAWYPAINPVITPAEAFNIDTKMDDGLPDSGKMVRARMDTSPTCVSGASYNITNTNKICGLQFLGF